MGSTDEVEFGRNISWSTLLKYTEYLNSAKEWSVGPDLL